MDVAGVGVGMRVRGAGARGGPTSNPTQERKALQAAIDSCIRNSMPLYIPPGDYQIDDTLHVTTVWYDADTLKECSPSTKRCLNSIPFGFVMRGAGARTRIRLIAPNRPAVLDLNGVAYSLFEDFWLDTAAGSLGHETAGHDILGADTGLRDQLAQAVQRALSELDAGLAEYWSQRIDETASDVMGILNMGPAAGIGLVGYFRGLNAAFGAGRTLRNVGPASDPHPADIVRGYLATETVRQLKFTGHAKWADLISAEADKDVRGIVLDGVKIDKARAKKSAEIVARTLVGFKAPALEQHALGEIQNWRDTDERQVKRVRNALRTAVPLSRSDLADIYAAHVVAAGVVEALESPATLATTFARMLSTLKAMHDVNPSWGPLHVHNPGNLRRDLAYIPSPPEVEAEEVAVVEPRARNTVRAGKSGKGSLQVQPG